jgi:hypothetical protein
MPGVPESVTEVRLWIVPRNDDGGADVYGEGDTAEASESQAAVLALKRLIDDQNSIGVQLLTQGLLNHVELQPDDKTVRLHLRVTHDQIEVILAYVAGRLGVSLPPNPDSPAPGGHEPPSHVPGSGW